MPISMVWGELLWENMKIKVPGERIQKGKQRNLHRKWVKIASCNCEISSNSESG